MTILAAVKTSTDVVIAADSKISTLWRAAPGRLEKQSFDSGTKLVTDASGTLVCAVAGAIGGWESPMDFFRGRSMAGAETREAQQEAILAACGELATRRAAFFDGLDVEEAPWSPTVLLLAAPDPEGWTPRLWRVVFERRDCEVEELLVGTPGPWIEGDAADARNLILGFRHDVARAIVAAHGASPDDARIAVGANRAMTPLAKINFGAMPTPDAVRLAWFLATVQVEMDRVVAGQDATGGPVDVAVVHGNRRDKVTLLTRKGLALPSLS